MLSFRGVIGMALRVALWVVVLVSVSLCCGFNFAIHSTFKGGMFADKIEKRGCRYVCVEGIISVCKVWLFFLGW